VPLPAAQLAADAARSRASATRGCRRQPWFAPTRWKLCDYPRPIIDAWLEAFRNLESAELITLSAAPLDLPRHKHVERSLDQKTIHFLFLAAADIPNIESPIDASNRRRPYRNARAGGAPCCTTRRVLATRSAQVTAGRLAVHPNPAHASLAARKAAVRNWVQAVSNPLAEKMVAP
jgi:hypothetical protein